jgi:hypothetical protein
MKFCMAINLQRMGKFEKYNVCEKQKVRAWRKV